MLNANGGDVRHDGQQIQIFAAEISHNRAVININQPNDTVAGLQRHGDHAAHAMHDDAVLLAQGMVHLGVTDDDGSAALDHAVSHGRRDRKAITLAGPYD